jgi:hypothetical protein
LRFALCDAPGVLLLSQLQAPCGARLQFLVFPPTASLTVVFSRGSVLVTESRFS